mgnify:CR=1 FL=1
MLGNDYKSLKENLGESNDALDLLLLLTENELENDELLDVQKQIQSFLKFLDSEHETVKKLEEENS